MSSLEGVMQDLDMTIQEKLEACRGMLKEAASIIETKVAEMRRIEVEIESLRAYQNKVQRAIRILERKIAEAESQEGG